jgi:surfactin synthase thioesterase subunit
MSRALAPNIEVLAIQYPGRQDRRAEQCIDNIPVLVDRLFEALESWTAQPFAFFGHSMGAILAFEVAQRLQQRVGITPQWLVVSGRPAPSRSREEYFHLQDDSGLVAELKRAGGTDQTLLNDTDVLAMILPQTRNDYKAIETYRYVPGPPLRCPITALVGAHDPKATIGETMAWAEHTTAEFTHHVFPGGHFFLQESRNDVAGTITSTLDTASRASQSQRG